MPLLAALLMIPASTSCRDADQSPPTANAAKADAVSVAPTTEAGFAKTWDKKNFDHGLWDRLLREYVDDRGRVDYAGFAQSAAFGEYLHRLAKTDAAGLGNDHQRLAFWINAYNALTITAVLRTLPGDRTRWPAYRIKDQKIDGKDIWDALQFTVGGGRWTLNQIELEILRKQDGLRDPRIHVALVCAARGCPPLWNRAYTGRQIDAQLREALRRFVNNPQQCAINVKTHTIRISKVFQWYAADFTDPRFSPHADSIPAFLAMGVSDPAVAAALKSGKWQMEYFDYDWRLNIQPHGK